MLYHGPVEAVLPWFASLGFACPPRKEVPSFLQDLTTASGQRVLTTKGALAAGGGAGTGSSGGASRGGASTLVMSLEQMEAAFWSPGEGPGAAMRQALEAGHAPEVYANVPRVRTGFGWEGGDRRFARLTRADVCGACSGGVRRRLLRCVGDGVQGGTACVLGGRASADA